MKKLNLEYIYEYQAKQYSFMQLPMLLITGEEFRELDYGCKILYGLLLSRVSLSLNAKNRDKFMDEKGRIFILFSSKEIADKMKCSRRSAVKYIRLLENYGLIELREENGYSSKIFVKDFAGVQDNTSKETESSVKETEGTRAKVAYPPMQSLHTPRAKFAHPNKIDRKIYKDNYIYNKQKNPSITQEVYRGLGKRGNIDLSKAEYNAIINDFGRDRGLELIDIVSDKIFSRGKENEKIRYIYPYIKKVAESLGYIELSQIKKDIVITENNLNSYYRELQKKAENKALNSRKEIDNISDIKKIRGELNSLYIKKIIANAHNNQVIIDKIAKDISSKEQEKKLIYKKYGIDEENFKAKFICDKCDDTGYIKGSMEPCSCRHDRERELREKMLKRKLQEGI